MAKDGILVGAAPPIDVMAEAVKNPVPTASECEMSIVAALMMMREAKPNDRTGTDRHYAVVITDMEKVLAYYKTFVADLER